MKNTLLLIALILIQSLYATEYFVDGVIGLDTNEGSEENPWATIQKAANTALAGDTVYIKEGEYFERVVVANSGTSAHHIVFTNFETDQVILNGTGLSWGVEWNGLFDVSNKAFIEVSGIVLQNAYYGGFWAENSHHILIHDNHTINTISCGIGVWECHDVVVDHNEVELACNDGNQECISISNSFDCEVKYNHVHHNGPGNEGGEGIDVKEGSHDVDVHHNVVHHLNNRVGIYADAWDLETYNINIYNNVVHHCTETGIAVASESGGTISYVNIYNNISYQNKYGGIELGSWSDIGYTGAKPLEHIDIINNTCFQNGNYDGGWGFGIAVNNPDASAVQIRNNICSENSAQLSIQQIASPAQVDHNLLFGNNEAEGTLTGDDAILINPLFVDSAEVNFYLQASSPAIDTGTLTGAPNSDFNDTDRPFGTGIDRGAYEYSPTYGTIAEAHSTLKIKGYPNPCTTEFFLQINEGIISNYSVKLFDLNGRLVRSDQGDATAEYPISIDTKGLTSGVYFIAVVVDKKHTSRMTVFVD